MVNPENFIKVLTSLKVSPFIMVPCSIYKPLANWMLNRNLPLIIPPNEAHAIGFATGVYSATSNLPAVFIQNSGLNNIANAQTSLNLIYKIPALIIVSWRGEKPEAPEHDVMGESLKKFLNVLHLPFEVLAEKSWKEQIRRMTSLAKKKKTPTALVIRKGFFEKEEPLVTKLSKNFSLSRIDAIRIIKNKLSKKSVFISATGHPSRDSYAVSSTPDFYTMGSMGHVFSIGAGTTWQLKKSGSKIKVVIFDGDGGCLMHLGSLAMVGIEEIKNSNLIYVVLDNEAYESTGNQPSLSTNIDFVKVAKGLGFQQAFKAVNRSNLIKILNLIKPNKATFIHVKVNRKKEKTRRVSDDYTCEQVAKRFSQNVKKLI